MDDLRTPAPFEVYQHFKNNDKYMVIGVFTDSDGIDQVSYIALYPPYKKHTRPLNEWVKSTNLGIRYKRASNLGSENKC